MSLERQPVGPEPALTLPCPGRRRWALLGSAGGWLPGAETTDWRLKLDPENVGITAGWPERGLPGETVAAEVPGVWNTIFPGYAGVAWYEARCQPRRWPGGTVRLVIVAANYQTDAWLNGVYLGRHEGGYDAFSFRCTDILRDGENRVTLRILDPPLDGEIDGLSLRTSPTGKESWYGGFGGPWGGVWLEWSPRVWLHDVRIHGDLPNELATFQVAIASGLAMSTSVHVEATVRDRRFTEPSDLNDGVMGQASASIDGGGEGVTHTLVVPVPDCQPWSPESPTTYTWQVTVTAPGEEHPDVAFGAVGFRTCEWRDGRFFLNGEPRYLKGALLQPTYPRTLALPPQTGRLSNVWHADVEAASAAGLNLLRCHLRPPPRDFLNRCDRQGMMTYVEPPLAWIEPSGRLLEHGKRELAAMVRACGSHPSVVMWGIFNENARATEVVGGALMAELAALDPTRPIIENSGGAAVGEVGMWAWGGQSRCWSPGWDAPRPLNDVHIYVANPLRKETRKILATVGSGPTLDVTPGHPPAERIESRMAADAVLVSEYGCGALPDFDAALAAFEDEQHLSDAVLLRDLRDDLAQALAERGLDREIGDVPSLVARTQALQAEGILAQTATLRRNPNVSGIILTQLADAGWEQMAGLVGLWRHPRPALEAFTRALRPRVLHAEPADPSSNGAVRVRSWLIEEPGLPRLIYAAILMMTLESGEPPHQAIRDAETLPVLLPDSPSRRRGARGPGTPFPDVTLSLPAEPGRYQIRVRLKVGDWSDEAVCRVRRLPNLTESTGEGLVVLGRGLRSALPAALTELPSDWAGPIVAHLPSRPARAALAHAVEQARAGAHLCLVGLEPRHAGQVATLLDLPIRLHGARGNFMGMHHYLRDHPLFAGLGAPGLADDAFADVLPAWALAELPGAEIPAGCFTVPDGGRAFLWRGSVQTLPFGRGRLTVYQLRASHRQGGALGRYLLDTLCAWLDTGRPLATV